MSFIVVFLIFLLSIATINMILTREERLNAGSPKGPAPKKGKEQEIPQPSVEATSTPGILALLNAINEHDNSQIPAPETSAKPKVTSGS